MLSKADKNEVLDLVERVVRPAIDDAVAARLASLGLDVPVGPREYRVVTGMGDHDIGGCTDAVYGPDWVKFVAGDVTLALFPAHEVRRVLLVREGAGDG